MEMLLKNYKVEMYIATFFIVLSAILMYVATWLAIKF